MSFPPKSVIVSPPELAPYIKVSSPRPPVRVSLPAPPSMMLAPATHQCIVKVRSNDILNIAKSVFVHAEGTLVYISSRASYQNQQSCYNPLQWDEGHCPLAAGYVIPCQTCHVNKRHFLRTTTLSSGSR